MRTCSACGKKGHQRNSSKCPQKSLNITASPAVAVAPMASFVAPLVYPPAVAVATNASSVAPSVSRLAAEPVGSQLRAADVQQTAALGSDPPKAGLQVLDVKSQLQKLCPKMVSLICRSLSIAARDKSVEDDIELLAAHLSNLSVEDGMQKLKMIEQQIEPVAFDPFTVGVSRGQGRYGFFVNGAVDTNEKVAVLANKLRGHLVSDFTALDVERFANIIKSIVGHKNVGGFMVGKASSFPEDHVHTGMVKRFGDKYGSQGYKVLIGLALRLHDPKSNPHAQSHILELESSLHRCFRSPKHPKFEDGVSNAQSGALAKADGKVYVLYVALRPPEKKK